MVQPDDDEKRQAVYVWLCLVDGKCEDVAVRATRDAAETWIKNEIGSDGAWYRTNPDAYYSGDSVGTLELVSIPDATAILVEDVSTKR